MKKLAAIFASLFALTMILVPASSASAVAPMCKTGYYANSSGRCVHSPMQSNSVPSGASARCGDGTYSFSQSRRGTCSHHGGVASWL